MIVRWAPLLLILLFVLCCVGLSCNSDDDEEEGDLSTPTPPPGACENNQSPALTGLRLVVGGDVVGNGESFMEASIVDVYLTYDDADCNVGGGAIHAALDDEEMTQYENVPIDAPCSAEAGDQVIGFQIAPVGVGGHQLSVRLVDYCGGTSEVQTVSFALTPWSDDDDDDNDADDDTVEEPTLLSGAIDYAGEDDLSGRPVYLFLYENWLPDVLVPAAWKKVDVPAEGFPFDYQWDMDAAYVVPGNYYLAAFADAVAGDGWLNAAVDPVHSPYLPTAIVEDQTTVANVTLVPPGR